MRIILISGPQGSGKTTLVNKLVVALQNRFKGYRAISMNFADPLYQMHDYCRGVLRDAGITPPHNDTKDGNLLQILGTEWGRNHVHPDVWVRITQGRIQKKLEMSKGDGLKYFFIIGDCRFKNEITNFPDAFKVRLSAPMEIRKARASMWRENTNHASERDLDGCEHLFDLVINTGIYDADHVLEVTLHEILTKGNTNAEVTHV